MSSYSDVDEKNLDENHKIIKGARILYTNKLSSKEIYLTLNSNLLTNLPQTSISKNCLKTQLLIGVKFTYYRV